MCMLSRLSALYLRLITGVMKNVKFVMIDEVQKRRSYGA